MKNPIPLVTRASARRPVMTVLVTVMLMGGLGLGMLQLQFEDDPFDSLPRGNPHTEATGRFFDNFPGGSYASPVFFEVAPEKWQNGQDLLPNRPPYDPEFQEGQDQATDILDQVVTGASGGQSGVGSFFPGPFNITDEVYLRGQDEFWEFISGNGPDGTPRVPGLNYSLTLSSNVKLVNYTNTGIPGVQPPDETAFAMPSTSPVGAMQFTTAWQGRYAASPSTIATLVSPDWRTIRDVFLFEPGDQSLNEVGANLEAAVEAYRDALRTCDRMPAACELTWNVFDADGVTVDPRSGTAAASYLTKTSLEDLKLLGPIVAGLLAVAFFLAFRRVGTVVVLAAPMLLAGVGVLGAFGLIGLPIHSVSLLVFPILMGNGIDFAIHMASAYHNARLEGADKLDAAARAGESAGTPLFVATLTTVLGMLLLVFAPNQLLSQLGLAIILGMLLLLAVSLTTLPAALTWTQSVEVTRRSGLGRALEGNARFWHRNKILGTIVVVVLAGTSLFTLLGAPNVLVVGTPAAFFPEGDQQREEFDHTNEVYFGGNEQLVTNLLILEGDLTRPEAQWFLRDLEVAFRLEPYVQPESVTSVHFALNSWIQVRQGTAGAPLVIAQESISPGSSFPQTQKGIEDLLDEVFATPLDNYLSFFIDADTYQMGSLVIEMEQPSDFEELEDRWLDILGTIDRVQAEHPDSQVDVHVTGATAVGYLFAKEEIPYLQVAGIVGIGLTGLVVLAVRRRVRDAVTVSAVTLSAGLWWVALLTLFNIPISITLVGPIVLIAAIGSDYALHMRYGIEHEGSRAWQSVGRAVFFSAATDIGAFLVFTQMRYGVLRDATVATSLALLCCLVATLILVPILSHRDEMAVPGTAPTQPTAPPTPATGRRALIADGDFQFRT